MQINRRTFLKRMNWALASGIGMLGFVGCEEYDSPYADYTVKGEVVNKATGKPIEGIQVGYYSHLGPYPMYGPPPAIYKSKASVLTNAKGEFKLTDRFYAGESYTFDNNRTLPVHVQDVDGGKNGLFQSEVLQVDFSKAKHSGKSKGWYNGEYTVNVNVELTEITN